MSVGIAGSGYLVAICLKDAAGTAKTPFGPKTAATQTVVILMSEQPRDGDDRDTGADESIIPTNEEVRQRQYCQHCGISVKEEDYTYKYAQAGGHLTGPFCGKGCQLRWLIDPTAGEGANADKTELRQ